jgi:hypothetical protein
MDVPTLIDAGLKEIPKLASALILLGLAWFVGQRISMSWSLRQKRKENELATARDLHALYGEFFAIWKLWNYYIRYVGAELLPNMSRSGLLDRTCSAEGRLESMLVRLACEGELGRSEVEVLGQFRHFISSCVNLFGITNPRLGIALTIPAILHSRTQPTKSLRLL